MNIVSVHVHYFSFTPVYVRQVRLSGTPVYICLHQFTSVDRDVELDKNNEAVLIVNYINLKYYIFKEQ